ncbi:hypothetical protein GOP47_0026134 [Adiantum capillus-veneris]|uniref:Uncharacterized protein n=1 Tax=Adiantum capillus-veneris TaxID=13818 RepID=A0A9D4Z3G9_ADICA|nr:hypothetical protein GOP47_0026134 [Adiantum capillus-veneris]
MHRWTARHTPAMKKNYSSKASTKFSAIAEISAHPFFRSLELSRTPPTRTRCDSALTISTADLIGSITHKIVISRDSAQAHQLGVLHAQRDVFSRNCYRQEGFSTGASIFCKQPLDLLDWIPHRRGC